MNENFELQEYVKISIVRYNAMIEAKKEMQVRYEEMKMKYEMIENFLRDAYDKDHAYGWVSVRGEFIEQVVGLKGDEQ